MTLADDLELVRHSVGAAVVDRDVVRVHGPEAGAYLQGQLSQDVTGLPVGGSAWAFVLQPPGKVDSVVRVTRTGEDEFVRDGVAGWSAALVDRLRRCLLRTTQAAAAVRAARAPPASRR